MPIAARQTMRILSTVADVPPRDILRDMFKAVDADGNGVLDKTEFIRLAKSDQLRLTRRKAVARKTPTRPSQLPEKNQPARRSESANTAQDAHLVSLV